MLKLPDYDAFLARTLCSGGDGGGNGGAGDVGEASEAGMAGPPGEASEAGMGGAPGGFGMGGAVGGVGEPSEAGMAGVSTGLGPVGEASEAGMAGKARGLSIDPVNDPVVRGIFNAIVPFSPLAFAMQTLAQKYGTTPDIPSLGGLPQGGVPTGGPNPSQPTVPFPLRPRPVGILNQPTGAYPMGIEGIGGIGGIERSGAGPLPPRRHPLAPLAWRPRRF